MVLMRLTCWVAEATTGTVVGRLGEVALSQMTKSLWGGTLRGEVLVELVTDTGHLDWPAIASTHAMLAPRERTIIVTGERTTPDGEIATGPDAAGGIVRSLIGEWVIESVEQSSGSGSLPFMASGWEEFLGSIAQPMHQVHTDVNPLIPAASLFRSGFATAAIAVPDAPSPIRGSINRDAWSGTIADAIAELQTQGGGWEWVIDLVPIWDGERLARVERTLRWGVPIVTREDNLLLHGGGWDPGAGGGNCVISRSRDAARWARVVAVAGAGEGVKQIIGYGSLDPLPPGRLDSSRVVAAPTVTAKPAADALANRHAQELRSMDGPFSIDMSLEGQYLPRVGALPRVIAYRSPGFPSHEEGVPVIDTTLRIGEIAFQVSAQSPIVERATLKVA